LSDAAPRSSDELQLMVDELAEEIGRSVVVNDPVVRLICSSRHFGDEDGLRIRAVLQRDAGAEASGFVLSQGVARWARPGMLAGRDDLEMLPRLCVPLRERGELLGLLMVIDADGSLATHQIDRISEVSHGITAVLLRDRLAADGKRRARESALRGLLDSDAPLRRNALATSLTKRWLTEAPHLVVTVFDVGECGEPAAQVEVALRTVLDSAARGHARRVGTAVNGDRAVALHGMSHPDRDGLRASTRRMVAELDQLLGRKGTAVAGIGGEVGGLDAAWISHSQAATAATGARLLPQLDGVASWDELGVLAVLLQLPASALTPALVPDAVRALLDHHRGTRLVETLRTFLDLAGSIPRTAAALHLHRTSLYYRLQQIRDITGLDLDDGEDRLQLHLGLRIADLVSPSSADRRSRGER